ncbi:hypothetical protein, partial [Pseudomonas syringae]|uniref:hypothetical protein n=1 Tax=Pseudomonas syringae TaxID=317 RepID=UPI001E39AF01
ISGRPAVASGGRQLAALAKLLERPEKSIKEEIRAATRQSMSVPWNVAYTTSELRKQNSKS